MCRPRNASENPIGSAPSMLTCGMKLERYYSICYSEPLANPKTKFDMSNNASGFT